MVTVLYYYGLFIFGALTVLGTAGFFIVLYKKRNITLWSMFKLLIALAIGLILLRITAPSLKYVLTKDFDVVTGQCTVDIYSSGRSADAIFNMEQTGEQFDFNELPKLDAFGNTTPYQCELTVTKDHLWTMDYKIYDVNTGKLIDSFVRE